MGRLIGIILTFFAPMLAMAQEDPEYRAEIGGGIGLVSIFCNHHDINTNICISYIYHLQVKNNLQSSLPYLT